MLVRGQAAELGEVGPSLSAQGVPPRTGCDDHKANTGKLLREGRHKLTQVGLGAARLARREEQRIQRHASNSRRHAETLRTGLA
jgi:hypothetical protein